jgi:hypothetical protein
MSLGPFSMQRSHTHHNQAENAQKAATGANTGHSRSSSASSFGKMMMGKGKEKMRKESISNPTPLASPFDKNFEKEDSTRSGMRYEGRVVIGEAI